MPYSTPTQVFSHSEVIKKSRFIGFIYPAESKTAVKQYQKDLKMTFSDARHICWAYQIGPPHSPLSAGMSDDGEPSGTAGKPILNVIQHNDLSDLVIFVVRYFGGIKLGTGGLVRAYGLVAKKLLDNVTKHTKTHLKEGIIEAGYQFEPILRHRLTQYGGAVNAVEYQLTCNYKISIPEDQVNNLSSFCRSNKLLLKLRN